MICDYKKLTPWQRYQALIAFSESNEPPCSEKDFEKWSILYHRERLNPEDHFVNTNEMVCDSPNTANK